MAIDGDWDVTVKTPMGDQRQTVTFKTEGAALTGKHENQLGVVEIKGGRVDGDRLTWHVDMPQPMSMKLDIEVQVSGDTLSGTVKTPFGPVPLQGVRML
jgi:hypothetical protein